MLKSIMGENVLMVASGNWSTYVQDIRSLSEKNILNRKVGAVITKSCTAQAKEANTGQTIVYHTKDIIINSFGLPNPGFDYYLENIRDMKNVIVSIAYSDGIYDLLKKCKGLVEVNVSCPNTKCSDTILGYDVPRLEIFLCGVNHIIKMDRIDLKIGLKLPTYIDTSLFRRVIELIDQFSIVDYIVISNSIPNAMPLQDTHSQECKPIFSNKTGGISGAVNKYISLANIHSLKNTKKHYSIVACGGVYSENDIDNYIKVGSNYVQVASYLLKKK